jgi:diamine N-acetyltransferase
MLQCRLIRDKKMLTQRFFKNSLLSNSSPIIIRQMTIADINELSLVAKITVTETYPSYFSIQGLDIDFYYKKFSEEFVNQNIQYIICEKNNKIIGYAKIMYHDKAALLDKFYLLKAYHGKGYGEQLLFDVYQRVVNKNIQKLELNVWDKNISAIGFYQKFGLIMGEKINYIKLDGTPTEDYGLLMRCEDIRPILKKCMTNSEERLYIGKPLKSKL